jgi:hypothetical protein
MTNLVFEPSHTTHWKNLFPSKTLLLGSHNLNDGEELVATIKSVGLQEIKDQNGKTEQVPVMVFENAPPMVLNITNSTTIASLYGDKYDQWAGKSVQIYATKVKAFGEVVTALRIREAIPDVGESIAAHEKALRACQTLPDLQKVFMDLPKHLKPRLTAVKDEMKEKLNRAA